MTKTLANQVNGVAMELSHVMTSQDVLRLVSFGSNLVGNTAAINLAAYFGNDGKEVVIVDLIANNQSLRKTLGIVPDYLVEDYLNTETNCKLNNLMFKTKLQNVSVVSTNVHYRDINELNALLETLCASCDLVILNEAYSNKHMQSLAALRVSNYSVLVVDQSKTIKRRFVHFLNGIEFEFDGYVTAK